MRSSCSGASRDTDPLDVDTVEPGPCALDGDALPKQRFDGLRNVQRVYAAIVHLQYRAATAMFLTMNIGALAILFSMHDRHVALVEATEEVSRSLDGIAATIAEAIAGGYAK